MGDLPPISSQDTQGRFSQVLGFQLVQPGTMRIAWQVWALWFAIFALYSGFLPRDTGYDIAHYHLHNGWSALNGRLSQDLAPADFHSFINPVHSMFVWWLTERLPGPIVMALLSPLHAASLPVLYALGARIMARLELKFEPLTLFVVAVTGYLALGHTLMHASVGNDHWGVLAFLTALALAIKPRHEALNVRALLLGSFVLGAAVGMKLTNAVYVPGYALIVLILAPNWTDRAKSAALCAIAGLVGAVLLGGWWAWTMWEMFGNPIYPNLSSAFGSSPFSPDEAFRDERFLPANLLDLLLRPFAFSFDTGLIYAFSLIDLRFLVGYLAVAFAVAWVVRIAVTDKDWPNGTRLIAALCSGFFATFLFWSEVFSLMRYANALWVIGPLLALTITVWAAPRSTQWQHFMSVAILACLALIVSTSASPSRRVAWASWDETYAWTKLPPEADISGAAILFSAQFPAAFNAPAFEKAAWLSHADSQNWSRPALKNYRPQIEARLASHEGPVFAVMFWGQTSDAVDLHRMADEYGYRADESTCAPMRTSFDIDETYWVLCPLEMKTAPDTTDTAS